MFNERLLDLIYEKISRLKATLKELKEPQHYCAEDNGIGEALHQQELDMVCHEIDFLTKIKRIYLEGLSK